MEMIINILISAAAFFIGARLLSGVNIKNFVTAIVIAVVVGVLNITLGVGLKIITLGILSFGIFTLFLDAILILVADWFIPDFKVDNFWWALGLSTIVAIISGLGEMIF